MEGLDALLREMKRVFAPGSAEAPFAWLLAAALLPVVLIVMPAAPPRGGPQRGRASVPRLRSGHAQGARDQRDRRLRAPRFGHGRRPEGARAPPAHRPFPAGEDLHRPFQLHPHLDADRARPRPAAGARRQLASCRTCSLEDDADWLEPARAERRRRWSTAAPTSTARCSRRLFQAARDHAAAWSRRARQAAAADPPAQGDRRPLARGERGAQDRAHAAPSSSEIGYHGADLPPHAARGPAVFLQLHVRRHPDRAREDARHAHRHRSDRRRHLRRLRHRR